MLRNVKDLRGFALSATDGVIGKVDDLYFDDEDWGIRYLVVNTGSWLSNRKVLISPIAVGHAGWMAKRLPVDLTRAPVEGSPDIDTRKPVSRQHEAEYFRYYGYPYYWGGAGLWGMGAYPGSLTTEDRIEEQLKAHGTGPRSTPDDCHLRSSNAVIGHHIWASGHRVLVSPDCIRDVSWSEAKVSVGLTRQAVSDLPLYESTAQLESTRDQGAPSGPAPEMRADER